MNNDFPIKGKWYEVVDGAYKGFVGECVSYDLNSPLPVILQDLSYNSKAVKTTEIKATKRQPDNVDINRDQHN